MKKEIIKEEKVNKEGLTMQEMFEINKINGQKRRKNERIFLQELRRKERNKNIFKAICCVLIGMIIMMAMHTNYENAIENCVEKGNTYEYCVGGLS